MSNKIEVQSLKVFPYSHLKTQLSSNYIKSQICVLILFVAELWQYLKSIVYIEWLDQFRIILLFV